MRSRAPSRCPALCRAITVAATIVALTALAAPRDARADDGNASRDAVRLDRFLDDHPWVARDLQRDPTLANDPGYL